LRNKCAGHWWKKSKEQRINKTVTVKKFGISVAETVDNLSEKWAKRSGSRPKVSVCMAVYQGERYIGPQLKSILPQLSDSDEVVIVDDGSTDSTCSQIAELQDSRLIVVHHTKNRGILRSFETALSRCSGEVIFLSDSDDLWLPKKVETVLEAFAHDADLVLVASDAILIDADGNKIGDSFYAQRGKFRAGVWSNLLVGKFHGCTMAFRSTLLQSVLPFPSGRRAHHDTWIGCVNALAGGKTKYIPEPLVAYRRHSSNDTGRTKNSTYTRLKIRLPVVLGLLRFWVKAWSRKAGAS
jgi:glycosyltransferase involved in cell wall biosynthesis